MFTCLGTNLTGEFFKIFIFLYPFAFLVYFKLVVLRLMVFGHG